ncbi:replicative DNA helicase [Pseudomonas sp. BCA14]|uniref:replicative DNA helicase n=1 Tax=unclassified Pseudomonas TaxID=196821 RepID=UPI00106F03AB|nr:MULTISPECIES: replicative DNA helicase [unclassified Pseudomonas]TFF09690.1 replicative DNA helicase [Pseudomonas sp. JMN1]TFF11832.1 replicative DNA helicase [Pseudomonas sp. BCA17]TFF28608.1 replicative DNA helicase [Pseudomonas sp. BCA14]
MRDPYSLEAEHGVLGAMFLRPELIDLLSADLAVEDFYYADNAAIYRGILDLHGAGQPVDIVTIGARVGDLPCGSPSFAYAAEIARNTPSVANAASYAGTVRERSLDRSLIELSVRINDIAYGDQPTADKVAAVQAEAQAVDSQSATSEVIKAEDILDDYIEVLQARADRGDEIDGLSTGIPDLDEKLQGLKPGQLIIIAGRPAMGKTTLAMNIASNAAIREGKSVMAFSLEMDNTGLMDRFMASEGRIPLQLIKNGKAPHDYGAELMGAAAKLKHSNLYLSDRASMSMNRMRAAARRHKRRYGLDLMVIDYLQLVDSDSRTFSREQEVSHMTRTAKLMARELGIPVILLSQLSRKCEERPNKRPMCSDLRESGAIEQDADIILFVYRDEVYHEHSEAKGIAEIIIGKGRDIAGGTVRAAFLGQYSRFEQLAAGWVEPPRAAKVTSMADRYKTKEKH